MPPYGKGGFFMLERSTILFRRTMSIVALALALAVGGISTAHAAPKPSGPLYIECSSTVWDTPANSGSHWIPTDNIDIQTLLYVKVDATDGTYCGEAEGVSTIVFLSSTSSCVDDYVALVGDPGYTHASLCGANNVEKANYTAVESLSTDPLYAVSYENFSAPFFTSDYYHS